MILHRLTVFCEAVHLLIDNRHFLAGVHAGHIIVPPPGPGVHFTVDAHLQFACKDALGRQGFQLRFQNTDGSVAWMNRIEFDFPTFDTILSLAVNRIVFPSVGPGFLKASFRDGGDWVDCGDLQVNVHNSPTAGARS